MREYKLSNLQILKYIPEILYDESIRIFNEHSMRLLLDHSLEFERQEEDITEKQRANLENRLHEIEKRKVRISRKSKGN